MRKFKSFSITNSADFKLKLLSWMNGFSAFCQLDSNSQQGDFSRFGVSVNEYDLIVGVGVEQELVLLEENNSLVLLNKFIAEHNDWLFGYLTYDLKNEIEPTLSSNNNDVLKFPVIHFFQPTYVFVLKGSKLEIGYLEVGKAEKEMDAIFEEINSIQLTNETLVFNLLIKPRINKDEYIKSVNHLKEHIKVGDVYEVNFCQEFYSENATITPLHTYLKLSELSEAPFSVFYRTNSHYLMCASPERFLKKDGAKIISQPIKGTIKRGKTLEEDDLLKAQLLNDKKERSENIMIVDLVRNDLSKNALRGSVKVDELFGVYSFKQVNQLISTVSAQLNEGVDFIDIIKSTFPMGSMTGAPKVRAMELIEKYESTKRGLYSGTVGYISPNGNFDFNVVIRSILYNKLENYLSFMVGSAITHKSEAAAEYEECLLKAKAMFEALKV